MSSPDSGSPNTAATSDLRWAYAIAGLSRKATAADARQLLMQRIEAIEFCPDSSDDDCEIDRVVDVDDSAQPLTFVECNALLAIADHPAASQSIRRLIAADESAWWRRKAAAFLSRAHTIDRDQRQQRLRRLKKSARFSSATRTRLRRVNDAMCLQGIAVDDASPSAQQLAGAICAIHPLSPTHRAQRMAELLEQCRTEPKLWRRAAKELSRRLPQIASLEPTLVERLYARPMELKRAAKGAKSSPAMAIEAPETVTIGPSSHYSKALLYFYGVSLVVLFFLGVTGQLPTSKKSAAKSTRSTVDKFEQDMARERADFFKILLKRDEDLTVKEKNQLILFGFANEDAELTGQQHAQLYFYNLMDARKLWRKHHALLPKKFIAEQPQPVHAKPQPSNKP